MMSQKFIEIFSALLTQTPAETLSEETKFKELPEWNSLLALSLMTLVEDECNVLLKGDDIRKAETLRDLFDAVERNR
ncbi:MAG: acyl carrier protein [Opitutales bacterium]|nr:acyl carrier protein [Opitutales bacterium]